MTHNYSQIPDVATPKWNIILNSEKSYEGRPSAVGLPPTRLRLHRERTVTAHERILLPKKVHF